MERLPIQHHGQGGQEVLDKFLPLFMICSKTPEMVGTCPEGFKGLSDGGTVILTPAHPTSLSL